MDTKEHEWKAAENTRLTMSLKGTRADGVGLYALSSENRALSFTTGVPRNGLDALDTRISPQWPTWPH